MCVGRFTVPKNKDKTMDARSTLILPELPNPAPAARRDPVETTHHGVTLSDPYAWLRDAGYPDVTDEEILDYLRAENAYFDAAMEPKAHLIETLFEELKGRIKDDDSSVPTKDGDYVYWRRFEPGAQYRQWLRRPAGPEGAAEEVILDEPALAEGLEFFRVRSVNVSRDAALLAWGSDTDGSERYTIRVKSLEQRRNPGRRDRQYQRRHGLVGGRHAVPLCRTERAAAALPGARPPSGRRPGG